MAELAELIPSLRSLLSLSGEEEALSVGQQILTDIGEAVPGDISTVFKQLSEDLEFEDGLFKVNNSILSENLEIVLSTGDLEPIFNMAKQEISVESREFMDVFKKLTSEIPERQLENIAVESRAQFMDISSESAELREIESNIDNTVDNQKIIEGNSKLKSVNDFFDTVKVGTKVIVVSGIAITLGYFLAEYIKNYISAKSGAFLISTTSDGTLLEQKISKYSCLYPKDAQIDHPFDKEISLYLHGENPCSEVDKYGPCAGWATIGPNSRLARANVNVSKLGKNKILKCRTATAYDAVFDLTNHFLKKVGDVVKGGAETIVDIISSLIKPFAPLLALLGGVIVSGITYYATSSLGTYMRIGIAFAVGIIVALIIYFLIKNFKANKNTTQSSQNEEHLFTETYLQCPMCRSSILDTCYQPFYVIHRL